MESIKIASFENAIRALVGCYRVEIMHDGMKGICVLEVC